VQYPAQKFPEIISWDEVNSFAEKMRNIVELFPDGFVKWRKIKGRVFL
jgi:hypothetical protein